jgi:hypothetical protein
MRREAGVQDDLVATWGRDSAFARARFLRPAAKIIERGLPTRFLFYALRRRFNQFPNGYRASHLSFDVG